MGSASVTVNVFDDSGTGHVSITVTDPTGKSVSYERQLDTHVIAASVFEGGALDGVIMVGSSLGPDDGVNQKIDYEDSPRTVADSVTISISDEQAAAMIGYADSVLGAVDYSLIGASCFNFAEEILSAGGVSTSNWINGITKEINAPIAVIIEAAKFAARRETILGDPGTKGYLGDKYSSSEAVREYVDAYAAGDLQTAAKVLVSGWNGDLISGETGFWPDRIIRQQAGYEPESPVLTTGELLGTTSTVSYTSGGTTYSASYVNGNGGGGADAGQAANPSGGASRTVTGNTTSQTTYSSGGKTQTATSVTGGGGGGADSGQAANPKEDPTASEGRRPILLDLDGDGVKITEFDKSAQFVAGKDGLSHRTSWAGAGDGVLFFDPDGRNAITEERQYVFTEWDPTATGDLEAIRSTFDSNGDGKLTAADAEFAKFKVMVTNADGSTIVKTLAELGITAINLTANAVNIGMPDGSVITGQTTFTRANGTTGTVANTALVAEAAGHRVVEVVGTDGVNRVVMQTGYDADGGVAFRIMTVTSPSGNDILRLWDENGDGVNDRSQRIQTVTNGDGSKIETMVNRLGSDPNAGIIDSRVVTATSADGKAVTIERDSTGGGWFDQREVWTTNTDGSRTEVLSELAQNGTVIISRSETVSAGGQVRTEGTDRDGNGVAETVVGHTITVAGDLSRTEVMTVRNGDTTLRVGQTETVSANGKVRTVLSDLDGDGDVDRLEATSITGAAGAVTTSVVTVKNGDGSVRSASTVVQSADALTRTASRDMDGDGDTDLVTLDQTVINGDGSRVRTVTATNTDGSVRSMVKETLSSDKVTAESWVDQNQDGVFQATDLVKSVSVDAGTAARTETVWSRNADGSVWAQSIAVTSADGLTTTTRVDADGDGDTDTAVSDVTTVSGGVATQVQQVTNQDGSQRSREVTVTSADGLTVTQTTDIDGNGTIDAKTVEVRALGGDGSVTRTVSSYAGNGTTLTGRTTIVESANRRTKTVATDTDGDGHTDRLVQTVEGSDGASTVTDTTFAANGAIVSKSINTMNANGLVQNTSLDADGDGVFETVMAGSTVLNANGSQTRTQDVNNGDGSNRVLTVINTSDDGLVTTTQSDLNGDGAFDRTTTSTTVLNANGSQTTTELVKNAIGQVLGRSQTEVSDDGLVTIQRSDADGDTDYDLVLTKTSTLVSDGGTQVVGELRDLAGLLREKTTTTISDDGRLTIVSADINGDGQVDQQTSRSVANDGTVTETSIDTTETGALVSQERTTISANGLTVTHEWDRDGDGQFERRAEVLRVLNADGSVSETDTGRGLNSAAYASSTVTTSDDGLTVTRLDDLDGNGTTDLRTVSTKGVATTGVVTETIEHRSADNSLIDRQVFVTSADRRTVTTTIDLDGDGSTDGCSIATLTADGTITTTTDLYSTGGVLEAHQTRSVSADGLTRDASVDRNADGRIDLQSREVTVLGSDGTVSRMVAYHNGSNVLVAAADIITSDDGLQQTTKLDIDGDGLFEARGETVTTLNSDGCTTTVQQSFDEVSDLLATITTVQSGDGLITTKTTDYANYITASATNESNTFGTPTTTNTLGVSSDRVNTVVKTADGAVTAITRNYGLGEELQRSVVETVSADGRTRTIVIDRDGDGDVDQDVVTVIDLGGDRTSVYRDLDQLGNVEARVTSSFSADGLLASHSFDVDADGAADFLRSTEVTYGIDGSEIFTKIEASGSGRLSFKSVTTTSANGLHSATQYDIDGDGIFDGSSQADTVLNVDGSRSLTQRTSYANGDLRSNFQTEISADGRETVEWQDYDGNGIADKIIERRVLSDGSTVEVETAYNTGGMKGQVFTTVTSADGLETTITRSGNEQTISRSALNNGSYTWNNGVDITLSGTGTSPSGGQNVIVEHEVDAFGIETWTMTTTWQYLYTWSGSNDTYTEVRTQSTTTTAQLDAEDKARVLDEAARIYDTVLDRNMDFNEVEQLVAYVKDGQLDKLALTSALVGPDGTTAQGEFGARYIDPTSADGGQNNAEFATQIYLNALGRAPTLEELDYVIRNLYSSATVTAKMTRAQIALEVSESVEHQVVGNSHLSSNNFDVILNPAQFERSLDVAYTRSIAERLIDTMYDRDATEQELDYLSNLLLTGKSNPDDLVAKLRLESGDIAGIASNSLKGLSGVALVEQAFINALGRQPTAEEAQIWEENLSAGYITRDQFIASLTLSSEKTAIGNDHVATLAPPLSELFGTAASETIAVPLTATTDAQIFHGMAGNDTLVGGVGSDQYIWSTGDGNDVIDDSATSRLETDVLVLTDVASTSITLSRVVFTDDLRIDLPNGAYITVKSQMANLSYAKGIEAIKFSDGVIWSLDDIKEKTANQSGSLSESIGRGNYVENMYGGAGNDTLNGSDGNDILVGGTGLDHLKGSAGGDTYIWSRGDGADTIEDNALSTLEVDRLVLTDVASTEVTISDVAANKDIIIHIAGTGGADILIKDRDYEVDGVRQGRGIEVIEFSDGVIWTLTEIMDRGALVGDSGAQNYSGTAFEDHYVGNGGNDTLIGQGGDDTLDGGTGDDILKGGNGSDTYNWRIGDGNDTIRDDDSTTHETDVLILEGVSSSSVALKRVSGSSDLLVDIGGEIITVINRFSTTSNANSGIEEIRFGDGVIWTLDDIWARTKVIGTVNSDVLSGTDFIDNIYGGDGADTISAGKNDDLLVGGKGGDILDGGAGNDRFEWSTGDGNDVLSDTGTTMSEVDTLVLNGMASSAATLTKSGTDLLIAVGGETITVKNRFNSNGDGRGVELIAFADGVTMEVLANPVGIISTTGWGAGDTLNGWAFSDIISGNGGADVIDAKAGDDTLIGGDGNDTVKGGVGSDTYVWTRRDDSDLIDDSGQSRTETDTLVLTDVQSPTDVSLKRMQGSNDLLVSINGSTAVITINNRFASVSGEVSGYGIEKIVFADGTEWTLDEILAHTNLTGTSAADALTGTVYADNIQGGGGNDTISTGDGDDILEGGTGADMLRGQEDSDTYIWSIGGGNDTIDDTSSTSVSLDKLVLKNVNPGQVVLSHASGSNNLMITIGSEVITVLNRFSNPSNTYGIEVIEFADGTVWNLDAILANTQMTGTVGSETLTGSGYADNMYGLAGSDTLNGGNGDDHLVGGTDIDSLVGGNGSDSYVWTKGDGSDTINDGGASVTELDRLVLTNVASTEVGSTVSLIRNSGTSEIQLTVTGTSSEVITIKNQMGNIAESKGIEVIEFSDGVVWTLEDILDHLKVLGTSSANTLSGTAHDDNIYGLAGNDALSGSDGDDLLVGGMGSDTLNGGQGVDTASYRDATQGVQVDLGLATAQTGTAGGEQIGDVLSNIEALEGSAYADILKGDANSNDLTGLAGNDTLLGKDGYDRLNGGEGNDSLDGGIGADLLTGGIGSDRFVFADTAFGDDEITDFEDGIDLISFASVIADSFEDLTISGNGTADVFIEVAGQSVHLYGAAPITLSANDFLFA
jgi:Ca2+-binding RTX toxin-like protein